MSSTFAIKTNRSQLLTILLGLLFIAFAAALIFMRAMMKGYNHDENQFIASAYLLARQGLLPYLDYPYFHMPDLVLIYALIFTQVTNLLFWTRIFAALCGIATLGILCLMTYTFFNQHSPWLRMGIAIGVGLLLLASPLFIYTSGRVWNHDSAILCLLLALVVYLSGVSRSRPQWWMFITGLFLAVATGIRLSFLTPAIAFGLSVFIDPNTHRLDQRRGLRLLLWMAAGFLVGMLPAILLFAASPDKFIFGNFNYARLNTLFRVETGYEQAMDLSGKLEVIRRLILNEPGNLLVFLLVVYFVFIGGALEMRHRRRLDFGMVFFMLLVIFTTLGAFLPTPLFYQYLYAIVPPGLLGVTYSMSLAFEGERPIELRRWLVSLLWLSAVLVALYGFQDLNYLGYLTDIRHWYPVKVRLVANQMRNSIEEGKILTLAPLFPSEAGLGIYPELATGPFAWRVAPYTLVERQKYHLLAPEDLADRLAQDPPAGILTGTNPDFEQPFVDYARAHGYQRQELPQDLILWVKPAPRVP